MNSVATTAAGRHIFIIGASSTGSTVLYRFMAYHRDLAWFSQWSNRDWTIPGRISFPLSRKIDRLGRRLVSHPWSKSTNVGPIGKVYQMVVPRPGDGGAAWASVFPRIDPHDEDGLARVARGDLPIYRIEEAPQLRKQLIALLQRALELQRKSRFLAKRPPLCFAVPVLAEVFPAAKFVHTLRDGKACVVSRAFYSSASAQGLQSVRLAAQEWHQTMRFIGKMEQDIGPDRWVNVRYEDYCTDVRGQVNRLLDFCELPRDEGMLTALPAEIRSTNSKRLREIPDEFRREIMAIAGEQLEAWGYAGF